MHLSPIYNLPLDKLRDVPTGGTGAGSGGPVFGVPLNQCVEVAPWRKRSACTLNSTGIDIPEITSPTASKASRSDSRTSVGSVVSVQDRVSEQIVEYLCNGVGRWDHFRILFGPKRY